MAIDVYSLPTVAQARATLDRYRSRIESGIGQAQTLAEIGGSAYLAARLSAHLGGPEGKAILGVPIELAIGAACGALAMSGSAGRHSEDVLAAGVGAIAAYTARLGFQAGLSTSQPPEPPAGVQGQIGAVAPAYLLPPGTVLSPPVPRAPVQVAMAPPTVLSAAPAYGAAPQPWAHAEVLEGEVMPSGYEQVVGDEIDSAVEVLDRIRR
ncbi:MAG: hypothetical protein IT384_18900 [Deltaproteobacteria bacterium]|nr:hypothetical protein [Deltaproteobacteria bacterium]